ncbi:DUF1566 domain-containing protein, partial [bacterium]|nr:DUF1566 domain-containing protein [bacterium]
TGLYWEVKSVSDGIADYSNPHDIDNTYFWYDQNPYENGGDAGFGNGGNDTEECLNKMNEAIYGGFSDWRLPTATELMLLRVYKDAQHSTPDQNYFPHIALDNCNYWSASSSKHEKDDAWRVNFRNENLVGEVRQDEKFSMYHVWAVRGCKLKNRLIKNVDGTISDKTTGLTWHHPPDSFTVDFMRAIDDCEASVKSGYRDWRLPDINELQTIIDYHQVNPASDHNYFSEINPFIYWSSTREVGRENSGPLRMVVDFRSGTVEPQLTSMPDGQTPKAYFILVRGGEKFAVSEDEITLNAQPATGKLPLDVTFICQRSAEERAAAASVSSDSYHWDFNDDGIIDKVTELNYTICNYTTAGTYWASCQIHNSSERTQKSTLTIVNVWADDVMPENYNYYLPYFSSNPDENLWTGLALASMGYENDDISVTIRGESGLRLVHDIEISLQMDDQLALPLASEINGVGWIQVTARYPLSGLAFVGSEYMADIPFIEDLSTSLVIPHIAQDKTWETSILICNPSTSSNQITIGNYYKDLSKESVRESNNEGLELRKVIKTVPETGSASFTLAELFGSDQPVTGMITLTAEKPIAAFALYKNMKSGGSYYAGINATERKAPELAE